MPSLRNGMIHITGSWRGPLCHPMIMSTHSNDILRCARTEVTHVLGIRQEPAGHKCMARCRVATWPTRTRTRVGVPVARAEPSRPTREKVPIGPSHDLERRPEAGGTATSQPGNNTLDRQHPRHRPTSTNAQTEVSVRRGRLQLATPLAPGLRGRPLARHQETWGSAKHYRRCSREASICGSASAWRHGASPTGCLVARSSHQPGKSGKLCKAYWSKCTRTRCCELGRACQWMPAPMVDTQIMHRHNAGRQGRLVLQDDGRRALCQGMATCKYTCRSMPSFESPMRREPHANPRSRTQLGERVSSGIGGKARTFFIAVRFTLGNVRTNSRGPASDSNIQETSSGSTCRARAAPTLCDSRLLSSRSAHQVDPPSCALVAEVDPGMSSSLPRRRTPASSLSNCVVSHIARHIIHRACSHERASTRLASRCKSSRKRGDLKHG